MAENRTPCCPGSRDMAYIDTYRIFDSCRDKDCFEDVIVFLTDYGREVIEHSTNVRCCSACIAAANITVNPVPFNNGFYQTETRIYVKMTFECCVCMTNRQIIEGIAVVDKRCVLFGGEGGVSVFRSDPNADGFCGSPELTETQTAFGCSAANLPTAVIELTDPVVLQTKIIERDRPCCRCCCEKDIPDAISGRLNGKLSPPGDRMLVVTLGLFTITRLQRPEQYLLNATEYSVPDKECECSESADPCSVFRGMEFPTEEFTASPPPKRR